MKSIAKYEENVKNGTAYFAFSTNPVPGACNARKRGSYRKSPCFCPCSAPPCRNPQGTRPDAAAAANMVAAATIFPPQALDRMAWPSCPPKYGGVFFRFCLGCAIASIGRPNLLDMSVPKNTPGTVTATVPDTNHLRPLRQASGGRADPGGAWPKPGKAAHPRPSWLRKSTGKPCVRGFLRLPAAARTALNRRTGR